MRQNKSFSQHLKVKKVLYKGRKKRGTLKVIVIAGRKWKRLKTLFHFYKGNSGLPHGRWRTTNNYLPQEIPPGCQEVSNIPVPREHDVLPHYRHKGMELANH
ncbi:uncharacterized protein LOC101962607 isoform X3 [Ictidomys tridecemlineatus]